MARLSLLLACTLALALAACSPAEPRQTAFTATGEVIAYSGGGGGAGNACVTCHGLRGEGDGRAVPRLAGLDAGYLSRQLDDYANGRREHEVMRAVVLRLDDEARTKVAAYYSELPAPIVPAAAVADAGAALYQRGDPTRALPSCASCHGVRGEGIGPGNPPLAGQPKSFLVSQLDAWRNGRRHNDALDQMLTVSRLLTAQEVQMVAGYAATLPGLRPREAQGASPAARRDGPRNDVSAPRRHGAGSSPAAG